MMPSLNLSRMQALNHSTAVLYDAARRLGLEVGLNAVTPQTAGKRLLAPAFTVKFAPRHLPAPKGLNLYDVIASVPHGHALVLEVAAERWICGANISRFAELAGLGGMVFDGSIRDAVEVRPRTFPIFALGTSVRGYGEELTLSAIGEPIVCGGVPVSGGDIVAGDEDGVVCLPADRLEEILFEAQEIEHLDEKLGGDVEAGRPIEELHATRLRWSVRRGH